MYLLKVLIIYFVYPTRAIIGRSWLEAALEYKPYIRPKVTVHKWSLEMGKKSIQAAAYNGARTVYWIVRPTKIMNKLLKDSKIRTLKVIFQHQRSTEFFWFFFVRRISNLYLSKSFNQSQYSAHQTYAVIGWNICRSSKSRLCNERKLILAIVKRCALQFFI